MGDILEQRDQDRLICTETERSPDDCVGLAEMGLDEGSIYPPVVWPTDAVVFTIHSEARVDDVVYAIEAVIDLTNGQNPRLLSWRAL